MGSRTGRRSKRWTGNQKTAAAVGVAALVLAGFSAYVVLAIPSSAHDQPTYPVTLAPPGRPANANLTGPVDPPVQLNDGRWGVDARADVGLGATESSAVSATGAIMVRWPGGALGDRFDPIANSGGGLIYNSNGTVTRPTTTFAQFVGWCRQVGCQSIVTLPAEINDPSVAAAIVSYSIGTLDFVPTYWEIGNEPLLWTHFGVPWTAWNSTQNIGTTPLGFATVVQAYVAAIRSVDPTTPIIGIGGVGTGADQSAWIDAVAAMDGPNLSGVAIHVYPAGQVEGPQPLPVWFASLWGPTALPSRVNSTRSGVADSCPGCNLTLLVDEFGGGTEVPAGAGLGGGYLASYVGAELIQSLPLDIRTLDYYNLASGTPGAWFSGTGTPSASYDIFAEWASHVGSFAQELGVSSGAGGLLAAVGGPSESSLPNLIVVNTNASFNFSLDLGSTFPDYANATILAWNGSASGPSLLAWGSAGPTNLTIPPMSLAIVTGAGDFQHADRPVHPESRPDTWSPAVSGSGWVGPGPGERTVPRGGVSAFVVRDRVRRI